MSFLAEVAKYAGISGVAIVVLGFVFRKMIAKGLLSRLNQKQSYKIVNRVILLFALISITGLGVYFFGNTSGSGQVTVLVHGEKGKDDLVLTNRGEVKLIYGDAIVVEPINSQGEATFKQIPSQYFKSDKTVEILVEDPEGEDYHVSNPDSLYKLNKGEYISLKVMQHGLDEVKGVVKDLLTGKPIDSVRVSILGAETFSNQFGEYNLQIPKELQKKHQTIRARKKEYVEYELKNVAIPTGKEHPIMMKPKGHNE